MPSLRIAQSGGILRLTIDRPALGNALDLDTLDQLAGVFGEVTVSDELRVVVLSGESGVFCAGVELDPESLTDQRLMAASARAVESIVRVEVPVVAAVRGMANGIGCALAAACDLIVAAESARFAIPFAELALAPEGGVTATLAASLGRHRALRMALLGDTLSAVQAYDAGLVGAVARDDLFDGAVDRVARRLAAGPTLAYAAAKRAVNGATLGGLHAAFEREQRSRQALAESRDAKEGLAAHLEGRRPHFTAH